MHGGSNRKAASNPDWRCQCNGVARTIRLSPDSARSRLAVVKGARDPGWPYLKAPQLGE